MSSEVAKKLIIECAHYLFEGSEREPLIALLTCGIDFRAETGPDDWDTLTLHCSRGVYDKLSVHDDPWRRAICKGLSVAGENHLNSTRIVLEARYARIRDTRWVEELKQTLPHADAVDANFRE